MDAVRLLPDGTPDKAFGAKGRVAIAADGAQAAGIVKLRNGSYVITGGGAGSFRIVGMDASGKVSSPVTVPFGAADDYASGYYSYELDNGDLLIAGQFGVKDGPLAIGFTKLLANGGIATGFGTNGKLVTDLGTGDARIELGAMRRGPSGTVMVSGATFNPHKAFVARMSANAQLDESFGQGGKKVFGLDKNEDVYNFFSLADGKTLVVLVVGDFNERSVVLAKLLANGESDPSFGSPDALLRENDLQVGGLVMDENERIYVSTSFRSKDTTLRETRLYRVLPTGSIDTSFGAGGHIVIGPLVPGCIDFDGQDRCGPTSLIGLYATDRLVLTLYQGQRLAALRLWR